LLEVWERQDEDFVETNHSAQVVVDHVPQQLELLLGEIYVDSLQKLHELVPVDVADVALVNLHQIKGALEELEELVGIRMSGASVVNQRIYTSPDLNK
jgi:hypothetical protein